MTESQALLADYATSGSETAFRELVRRYVDLVYSTALRLVNGDRHMAEDVAQTVFIDLAWSIRGLAKGVMLGGWLHRHTCFVARKVMRGERRRLNRERQAMEMNALRDDSDSNLAQVAPLLDEAIDQLAEADRTAILLRFFEQLDFRMVGDALGANEDAARMRVNRALGKLQALLRHRGVTVSSAALGTALGAGLITAAPSGLAASLAGAALVGAATGSGFTATLLKMTVMTKLKLGIVSAIVLGTAAIPLLTQHQSLLKLRRENEALQQQITRMTDLEAENGRLSRLVLQANSTGALSTSERSELLRLRGQIGSLRKELANDSKKAASSKPTGQQTETSLATDNYYQQAGVAKMNYTKNWLLAFMLFSQNNQGRFPTNFDEAVSLLPESAKAEHNLGPDEFRSGTPTYGLTPDRYEIVYRGSPEAIPNPQDIVVMREKEPWQVADGGWVRAYGFADGHTEIHRATDGDFRSWEAKHMVAPPQ